MTNHKVTRLQPTCNSGYCKLLKPGTVENDDRKLMESRTAAVCATFGEWIGVWDPGWDLIGPLLLAERGRDCRPK